MAFEAPQFFPDLATPDHMAVGDFDLNGFKDIAFITSADGKLVIHYNQGSFQFTEWSMPLAGTGQFYALVSADFNEDGKMDLAALNRLLPASGRLLVLLSTGSGFTTQSLNVPGPSDLYLLLATDLDGDGHKDILAPNINQNLTWHKGNGSGGFTERTENSIQSLNSMDVGDVNMDGLMDVVAGGQDKVFIYTNNGAGFSKATLNYNVFGGTAIDLILVDISEDGKKDILLNYVGSQSGMLKSINDGSGQFINASSFPTRVQPGAGLTHADFNNDGKEDIAVGSTGHKGLMVLRQSTGSTFIEVTQQLETSNNVIDIEFCDLDNDGSLEVVEMDAWKTYSIFKLVSGNYNLHARKIFGPVSMYRSKVRDINNDGFQDLVTTSMSNSSVAISHGQVGGTFGPTIYLTGTSYRVMDVETGDFNSDSYHDILFSELDILGINTVKLSLTNGAGHLQNPVLVPGASGHGLVAGDFNTDGKLDFYNGGKIFSGNGNGSFTAVSLGIAFYPWQAATGLFDNDNGLDLLIGDGSDAYVLLNNGSGTFSAPIAMPKTFWSLFSIRTGKFNADNLDDVFAVSNDNSTFMVYVNQGSGIFTQQVFHAPSQRYISGDLTVTDLNKDGLTDVTFRLQKNSNPNFDGIGVFIQKPAGVFTLKFEIDLNSQTLSLATGDVNQDGKTDILSLGNSRAIILSAFVDEPNIQASGLSILSKTDIAATIGFNEGNGHGRIALLRASANAAAMPLDDSFYSASTTFGTGPSISPNNSVLVRGDVTEVSVTGLAAGTEYIATVFEYNEDVPKSVNNYNTTAYPSLTFRTKYNQTITFDAITDKVEGTGPFTASAVSSSALPVTIATASSNITLLNGEVTILGPGPVTLTATQPGDADNMPAPDATRVFCINPVKPEVTLTKIDFNYSLTSSRPDHNQWLLNGVPIAGATGNTYDATDNGVYSVEVNFDGCSAVSDPTPDLVTSIADTQGPLVSPNPASQIIYLNHVEATTVELTSSSGVSYKLNVELVGTMSTVNIVALPQGLYILRINTPTPAIQKLAVIR